MNKCPRGEKTGPMPTVLVGSIPVLALKNQETGASGCPLGGASSLEGILAPVATHAHAGPGHDEPDHAEHEAVHA